MFLDIDTTDLNLSRGIVCHSFLALVRGNNKKVTVRISPKDDQSELAVLLLLPSHAAYI